MGFMASPFWKEQEYYELILGSRFQVHAQLKQISELELEFQPHKLMPQGLIDLQTNVGITLDTEETFVVSRNQVAFARLWTPSQT